MGPRRRPYCKSSGGSPIANFASFLGPIPFVRDFIIYFICMYCLSSWLIS